MNENKDNGFFSKSNDLRNRILFTILILSVYRLGTYVPLPGIDPESLVEAADEDNIPNPRLQMNKMIRRGILYVHLDRVYVT